MGFVKKTKTNGKWFEVNELVRNHSSLAEQINNNPEVKAQLQAMETIIREIATDAGITNIPDTGGGLAAQGFPVPKMLWFGTLAYDTHAKGADGVYRKVHEKAFRQAAKKLRDAVYKIIEALRLAGDAFDAPGTELPNPGGQVNE